MEGLTLTSFDDAWKPEPPTPAFAATSAEFNLFPKEDRKTERSRRSTHHGDSTSSFSADLEHDTPTVADLARLRSDAFWELHRSVAQNGEGLVMRMRDYEHSRSRSRSEAHAKAKEAQRRGRKRASIVLPVPKPVPHEDMSDEDEDDVQIFAGELVETPFLGSSRHPKRALSLGGMEESFQHLNPSPRQGLGSGRCSSPVATCDSSSSAYLSDDDNSGSNVIRTQISHSPSPPTATASFTPSLTHTSTESSNSSLVSLPLPSPLLSTFMSTSFTPQQSPRSTTLAASRSEKAIAALSLMMANGAGGLNDYEALRAFQTRSPLDYSELGEMWH